MKSKRFAKRSARSHLARRGDVGLSHLGPWVSPRRTAKRIARRPWLRLLILAKAVLAIGFWQEEGAILSFMRGQGRPPELGFDELVALVRDLPQGRTGQIVNCKI